jgi:glucose-6-phosphate 1-epimerase
MALVTTNHGPSPVALTEALHTYFAVSDVDRVSVTGLDGAAYLDKTDGFARKRQAGPIKFAGETDRIYLAGGPTRIVDAGLVDTGLGRTIALDPEGSGATVVWNAGPERAKAMADMPGDSWRRYVCVETANAADAALTLAPGAVHRMAVNISVG